MSSVPRPMSSSLNRRIAPLSLCLVVLLTLSARCALADDEHVWAALKQGGKVILLRHTHVDIHRRDRRVHARKLRGRSKSFHHAV